MRSSCTENAGRNLLEFWEFMLTMVDFISRRDHLIGIARILQQRSTQISRAIQSITNFRQFREWSPYLIARMDTRLPSWTQSRSPLNAPAPRLVWLQSILREQTRKRLPFVDVATRT